jgi:tetratricopeptide (TPR) repeat protein
VIWVRRLLRCFTALAVLTLPARLDAATPEDMAKAREHFAAARIHYDLKEYEPALQEFKDAYRWVQDPVFLFNIAQCHWKLGHQREAVDFYRNYLRRAPNAPNRPEVERRVQELEAAIKAHAPPPPTAPEPAPRRPPRVESRPPTMDPSIAVTPPPVPSAPAVAPPMVVAQPVPAAPRIYKTWWFWTTVAVVTVAAGAIAIGLAGRGQVGDCMGVAPCRDLGR